MLRLMRWALLVLTLLPPTLAEAQTEPSAVTLTSSRQSVTVGEVFVITLTMTGPRDGIFPKLQLGGLHEVGRSQSHQVSIRNGHASRVQTAVIRARAGTPGHYTAEADGREVTIRAVPAIAPRVPRGRVQISAQPPRPYAGQVIGLRMRLHDVTGALAGNVAIDTIEPGAGLVFLGSRTFAPRGREKDCAMIAASAPTPGRMHVGAIVVALNMLRPTGHVKLKSTPLTIDVQPLPAGAPPGFSPGSVGTFQLDAEVVHRGADVRLRVTVRGSGNLRMLGTPLVDTGNAWDLADQVGAQHTEVLFDADTQSGRRVFEWPLLARAAQPEPIRVTLPYFNTLRGRYETLEKRVR
ncbi:MAG: hypothetical protein ACI9WU_000121 [Myxococcota bacterium]|jgi:hypothetical protein